MTQTNDYFWHVIYTHPRNEKSVAKKLTDRKITKTDIQVFLPLRTVSRRWSDRNKRFEEVLFPCYVFVKVKQNERWSVVNTAGVVKFISTDGSPHRISEREMETIKKLSDFEIQVEANTVKGETIKIIHGPFAGVEGDLFEHQGNKRVLIYIKPINKYVSVGISDCSYAAT